MQHIAPLLQTVLWVGLLGAALWRFHKPIHGLLVALEKRIESGSSIKAGPFEITEQLKPQDPSAQREKAGLELAQILREQKQDPVQSATGSHAQKALAIQARYFQAEDFALRAIQAEYGKTVSRQVTAGLDMGFDGAFTSNGRLSIVEVKYISGASFSASHMLDSVDRIATSISRYGWGNVQIILAVVVENVGDVAKIKAKLQERIERRRYSVDVVMRCYAFAELQSKFSVDGPIEFERDLPCVHEPE